MKTPEIHFFNEIDKFAFYDALNASCMHNTGKTIPALMLEGEFKIIVDNLLNKSGLNYGSLPKGLLLFHRYRDEIRTPVQEHLAEGALYTMNNQHKVNIHFTVSSEHKLLFEQHLETVLSDYSNKYHATFQIGFSEQKSSTDTIAGDEDNLPFREDGALLFRPGGHGALIENLNDLDADIIFIKNIDNVVPDALKNPTIIYKKMIAGLLVKLQRKAFQFLRAMDRQLLSDEQLWKIADFCERSLNIIHPGIADLSGMELQQYLQSKRSEERRGG